MAVTDNALQLTASGGQAVTSSAKTTGTNDNGPPTFAGNSIGGDDSTLVIEVSVDVAATAAGAATVDFALRSSANADMSSAVTHSTTGPIGKALLVPGWKKTFRYPADMNRYWDVFFTVATGPLTAGNFSVNVASARQTNP